MIIGVTGGFGTGKSTVSELFRQYGFKKIDVDKLYATLFRKNKQLQSKLLKKFGTLDRSKIKKIVFNNARELKSLNRITHPLIFKELKTKIKQLKAKNKDVHIVVDIPLLFESKREALFDITIVVKATQKTQIKRIQKKKKHYTEKEAKQIITSQLSLQTKIKKADLVIDNNKSLAYTKKQVKNIAGMLS